MPKRTNSLRAKSHACGSCAFSRHRHFCQRRPSGMVVSLARLLATCVFVTISSSIIAQAADSALYNETRTPIDLSTPRGTLRGFRSVLSDTAGLYHGSADVFLGIPYVKPPTGERRWRKPEVECSYNSSADGIYTADQYKPSCPQLTHCQDFALMSEDCLYLNVISPNARSTYKYPVMVYIHGGGFKTGCTQEFGYPGIISNLASRGVVVVVIQYRLNIFGFFTTGTDDFPPNLGMLDQVEAVRWVADQIKYFGGDPYRITLFGQSAGGASVSALSYSPLSQDLFQQAIMESGVALTTFEGSLGDDGNSRSRAKKFCNTSEEEWAAKDFTALRKCLLDLETMFLVAQEKDNSIGWKMQVDDYFMPDIPHRLAPKRPNIPTIIGSVHDEFALTVMTLLSTGLPFEMFQRSFFEYLYEDYGTFLGDRSADMLNVLMNVYAGVNADDEAYLTWAKAVSAGFTSAGFTAFIHREFRDMLAAGNEEVYLYDITYPANVGRLATIPGWPEATFHTLENPYLFLQERVWQTAIKKQVVNADDHKMVEWFGKVFTDFAKFGKPTLDGSWQPLRLTGENFYLDIDGKEYPMRSGFMPKDHLVWNELMPALVGDVFPPEKTNASFSAVKLRRFDDIKAAFVNSATSCGNATPTQVSMTASSNTHRTLPDSSSSSPSLSSSPSPPSESSPFTDASMSSFSPTSKALEATTSETVKSIESTTTLFLLIVLNMRC